jgi:hypothetical protein
VIGKSIYHTSTSSTTLVIISTDYIGKIGKSIYQTRTSSTILVVISTDYIGKYIYHTSTTSIVEDVLV